MSEMKPGIGGANPLQKYFRQPKIYVALPSGGHWYPEGALERGNRSEIFRQSRFSGQLHDSIRPVV